MNMLHPVYMHIVTSYVDIFTCWTRTRYSFTTEISSVPMRYSFFSATVPASPFWVLQITLPCSYLSSLLPRLKPSTPSTLILPVAVSSSSLWIRPIGCKWPKVPSCWADDLQTGLPPRHSLRHWWLPLGHRKKRKSRPVLFGSLLGQACWFKEEKKGKGIRKKEKKDNNPLWVLPLHFQIAEVKTEC